VYQIGPEQVVRELTGVKLGNLRNMSQAAEKGREA
jgi:hypothetical protein